jgi:hypothetical protein
MDYGGRYDLRMAYAYASLTMEDNHMTTAEMVHTGITLLGTLIALSVFLWNYNRYQEQRIGKVYTRIDQVKDKFSLDHVRKDVCEVLNKTMRDDLREIKADLKKLLHRNGIDNNK